MKAISSAPALVITMMNEFYDVKSPESILGSGPDEQYVYRGGNPSCLSDGIVYPSSGCKVICKPQLLELALLKVVPVPTVSVLATSQLTGVSTIQVFGGLVW